MKSVLGVGLVSALACGMLASSSVRAGEPCDCGACGRSGADKAAVKVTREIPVAGSPTRGEAGAPVTLVAFVDLECPFCVRLSRTLSELEQRRAGALRVVIKHHPLPVHTTARAAALAAEAAHEQGRFWPFYEALMERQDVRPAALDEAARQAGLDLARWRKVMAHPDTERRIREDEELAQSLAVSGTPTLFINGTRINGAQPLEDINAVVADALRN